MSLLVSQGNGCVKTFSCEMETVCIMLQRIYSGNHISHFITYDENYNRYYKTSLFLAHSVYSEVPSRKWCELCDIDQHLMRRCSVRHFY